MNQASTLLAKLPRHVIDCDVEPRLPSIFWGIHEHRTEGLLVWDPNKISLFVARGQKEDPGIHGTDLLKELEMNRKKPLNLNVHDYLLNNQELIPEEWRKYGIYFFGTQLICSCKFKVVGLIYVDGKWVSEPCNIECRFTDHQRIPCLEDTV